MVCDEKMRLMKEYKRATERFAGAVREQHARTGTVPKSEYERLAKATDEARLSSEAARLAIEKHVAAHHC